MDNKRVFRQKRDAKYPERVGNPYLPRKCKTIVTKDQNGYQEANVIEYQRELQSFFKRKMDVFRFPGPFSSLVL